jgi:hypothetical protein
MIMIHDSLGHSCHDLEQLDNQIIVAAKNRTMRHQTHTTLK